MKIINTILVLFIIIIIINKLSDKKILTKFTDYINYFKNLINRKKDKHDNVKKQSFDTILNKIIVKTNKPTNNLNFTIASRNMVQILEKKLLKAFNIHFNKYNYKFHNLIISDNIKYSATMDGKYFIPFNFSVKAYYKNKKLDNLFFKIELFVKKDTNMILILNIIKETYNPITDILTEIDNNIMMDTNQNTNYYHDNYYNEPVTENSTNFNSMFIHNNNGNGGNGNGGNGNGGNDNDNDNNSSLIPNVNELNITDNNTDNNTDNYTNATDTNSTSS